jgi:opacity protein-like surface antigen
MTRFLLATTALVAASASAFAADLPARTAAPFVSSQSVFSWTGFYMGGFIGGAKTSSSSRLTYGELPNSGVGFANGSATSTWFNGYATGTPSATTPGLTADGYHVSYYNSGSPSSSENVNNPVVNGNAQYAAAPATVSQRSLVGALGLEAGYQHQIGSVVLGVVADMSLLSRATSANSSSTGQFYRQSTQNGSASGNNNSGDATTITGTVSTNNDGSSSYSSSVNVAPKWLSSLRLTAGIANDRLLTFVSGGLAVGSVQSNISSAYSDSVSSTCSGTGGSYYHDGYWGYIQGYVHASCGGSTPAVTAQSAENQNTSALWAHKSTKILTGFAVGGGFAYALGSNTILKLEGYYYNLGNVNVTVNGTGTTSTNGGNATATNVASYTVNTKVDGILGRTGIAVRF